MWTNSLKKNAAAKAAIGTLLLGVIASPGAHAAGAMGMVFDPTNYVENTLTATNAIRQVQNQVDSYLMQKYGVTTNLQGLPADEINQILISKMPAMKGDYVLNYAQLLQALEQQMGVAAQDVQQQFSAMSASGLSPTAYIDQETQMSNSDQAYAAAGYQQAQNAIKQVNAQAAVVQKQSDAVGTTVGSTSSMHLMQAQLSTLTTQNQQLLAMVAARQKAQSLQDSQSAADAAHLNQSSKLFDSTYGVDTDPDQATQKFMRGLSTSTGGGK